MSDEPDCSMCTNEYCLRCSPTGAHCDHDYMDRHIDTDGEFRCDDPPTEETR